jgi:hypothetical protein
MLFIFPPPFYLAFSLQKLSAGHIPAPEHRFRRSSFLEFLVLSLKLTSEKPLAGSQAASGKGGWYTTQGGVRVGLSFHNAFKIIDDSLKAFGSEKSGFPKFRIGLDLVLVYQAVQHIWINPVLLRKRRGTD